MTGNALALKFVVALVLAVASAAATQELKESPPSLKITENSAKLGDILVGAVARESKRELYLDTTPCAPSDEKKD